MSAPPQPVLTDRHGFILQVGDVLTSIKHNRFFRMTSFTSDCFSYPTVFELYGRGKRISVDASLTMFERRRAGEVERAAFCDKCFNHYLYQEIEDHVCPWAVARARRRRRWLAFMWCVPRLLRWKHRALQYFQGSLAALLAEGVAANSATMQLV